MRSFFYSLDKAIEDSSNSKNFELRNFYYDVKTYVMQGNFTRYKKVKELLKYWGQTDSYVSKVTGMKEGTVRVTRRNLSNELYEKLGYDFFTVTSDGSSNALKEGMFRLSLAKKEISSDKYLYNELIDEINRNSEPRSDIDITSCTSEIQFLYRHSRRNIEKEMSMLDKEKLAYIIKMLDNEEDTFSNIYNLVKLMERD